MKRFQSTFLMLVILSSVCFPGCQLQSRDNPGEWGVERVTEKIEERCEAADLQLTAVEDGFEGTGMRADGETLTIKITQDPDAERLDWHVTGDRGFFDEGFRENLKPGE